MTDSNKKKILVICPHPVGVAPGQRLKYEQYFDYLISKGYSIRVSPFMTMRFWNIVYKKGYLFEKAIWTVFGYFRRLIDLARLQRYEGIYVFLWVTPFGTTFFERLFSFMSRKLIYDIDDLVFLKPKSRVNPLIGFLKSENKPIILMKKANHVITCTPYLDEFVRRYNTKTTDISSTINTEIYLPKCDYSSNRKLVLGWSGSFSTSKYILLIENVLKKIQGKYDVEILVIGDSEFSIDGLIIESVAWNEKTEVELLKRIDIGLYPLPDEEWVYGKSGLKALQYMSLGIPTVATAIGANYRIIENGVSGFLVKTEQEWESEISRLILNKDLRKTIGTNARRTVEDNYSIIANRPKYLQIFDSVYR